MVIITNIYFPTQSSAKMKEILTSLRPKPDFLKVKGPYFRGEDIKGIHSMTIYEFENNMEADAYRFIMGQRIKPYFGVEGFSFNCNLWLETVEGFQMMDVE